MAGNNNPEGHKATTLMIGRTAQVQRIIQKWIDKNKHEVENIRKRTFQPVCLNRGRMVTIESRGFDNIVYSSGLGDWEASISADGKVDVPRKIADP